MEGFSRSGLWNFSIFFAARSLWRGHGDFLRRPVVGCNFDLRFVPVDFFQLDEIQRADRAMAVTQRMLLAGK